MYTAARLIPLRLPLTTLLLCGVAGAVFALPVLQALLIYNRAAIHDGEIWRLITGNLVHFSLSHFLYDVVALFVAGALIEIRGYRHFATLCLVSGALIGAILYISSPEIVVFGGLSGIVTATVTLLCLNGLTETGAWQRLCSLTLICLVIKMGFEMVLGSSLLAGAELQTFVPVPVSHVAGAATALLLFMLTSRAKLPTPPSLPSGG
jgi:rhomboid family GlyGly-CTERM serine protease